MEWNEKYPWFNISTKWISNTSTNPNYSNAWIEDKSYQYPVNPPVNEKTNPKINWWYIDNWLGWVDWASKNNITWWTNLTWWGSKVIATNDLWKQLEEQNKILANQKNSLTTPTQTADELKKSNDEYIKALEKSKADQQSQLEEQNKVITWIEQENIVRQWKIVEDRNKQLQDEKDAAVAELNSQKTQQKIIDEQNIKNQEVANNVAEQRSAWAYNKLWLGFSSWIIEQWQQIATSWQYALSLLKSQVWLNQTKIQKDIIKSQNDYNNLISENINKYNDLIFTYKKDAIDRLNNISNNKLKTNEEILKEKKTIADNFRTQIKEAEKQFREDQLAISDKQIANTEAIKTNLENIQAKWKEKLVTALQSWRLSKLTPEQRRLVEKELWMTTWELDLKENQWIQTTIRSSLDNIAWEDYSPTDMNDLIKQVKQEMIQWRTLEDATSLVLNRQIKINKDLQQAISEKEQSDSFKKNKDMLEYNLKAWQQWEENKLKWANYNLEANKFNQSRSDFNQKQQMLADEFYQKYWEYPTWYQVTAWNSWNRPDRNNNPWNVKIWDVWYGVDNQNHTIFWDANEWYQAMLNDLKAKVSWWSSKISKLTWQKLWPNSSIADLWSVYAEDPNWINNVISIANKQWYSINKNTKLSEIDINKLWPAIAKAEWFTWNINTNNASETINKVETPLENQSLDVLKAKANDLWVSNLGIYKNQNKWELISAIKKKEEENAKKEEENNIKETQNRILKLEEIPEIKDYFTTWDMWKNYNKLNNLVYQVQKWATWSNLPTAQWLLYSFWKTSRPEQKQALENISDIITTFENQIIPDSLNKLDDKWKIIPDNERKKKAIINKYLIPILKEKWIEYRDWSYYVKTIKWVKDFKID